ncbi:hypothetical protein SESBI_27007 [Sesbania bispinosa]|nr:hypothetical protein SESBI_27007 [Sesbania bispinosa]
MVRARKGPVSWRLVAGEPELDEQGRTPAEMARCAARANTGAGRLSLVGGGWSQGQGVWECGGNLKF